MTKFERIQQALEYGTARLPVLGILAFSMCSVNALYSLLATNATNDIDVFWFAAVLVELVTAWLVAQVVETFRKVTRSKISKQDRRFYGSLLVLFIVLCAPSLALSVWANRVEFGGSLALGLVFPGLSVACAVGAALPGVATKHEQGKAKEQQARNKAKSERDKAKAERARLDAETRQAEIRAQQSADSERSELEQVETERRQSYAKLGASARQIIDSLATDPSQTQASLAQAVGVTPQSVAHHIRRLSDLDLIKRNGSGIKVLVSVE